MIVIEEIYYCFLVLNLYSQINSLQYQLHLLFLNDPYRMFQTTWIILVLNASIVIASGSLNLNKLIILTINYNFIRSIHSTIIAVFEVISVIVMLNMLIATISNTFQKVTDNVDIEWTFGRTEVR